MIEGVALLIRKDKPLDVGGVDRGVTDTAGLFGEDDLGDAVRRME